MPKRYASRSSRKPGSASPVSKTTAERFEGIRAALLALGNGIRTTVVELRRELGCPRRATTPTSGGKRGCRAPGPSPTSVAPQGEPDDCQDDAVPPASPDEQEEGRPARAEVLARRPDSEGRPTQADWQGHHDELRLLQQAEPPVLGLEAGARPPNPRVICPLRGRKALLLSTLKDALANDNVPWELPEDVGLPFDLRTVRSLAEVGWLPPQVLLHSDQGRRYASRAYSLTLAPMGISQPMSRIGNCCWDNALMELWFGHAKDEIPLRGCEGRNR